MQHEVAAVDRLAQRLLDAEAVRRGDQQLGVVDADAIAAQLLGAEQRGVGSAQQRRGVATVIGMDGGAAADADRDLATVDQQRLLEQAHERARAPLDLGDVAGEMEHHRELVAAEPRDETGLAGRRRAAARRSPTARDRRTRGRGCR